jgi:hypothetical protein
MSKGKKHFLFLFLFIIFVFPLFNVSAYSFIDDSGVKETGIETGATHIDSMGNYNNSLTGLIGRIINIALGLLGIVFLGLSIYGGFIWMMARGDSTQIEKAQNIIKNSIIGLVIVLAAYAITNFVYSAFFSL